MHVGLPKWPATCVVGKPVTSDQAKEIIRRTDHSFSRGVSGNDHEYNRMIVRILGLPKGAFEDYEETPRPEIKEFVERWREFDRWREAWGVIPMEYLGNHWLACSYIGGPHGWCHPDGTIAMWKNIGKYPGAGEVFEEWSRVAAAFPFLDLSCTLFDREYCEDGLNPVITYRVQNGAVTVHEPSPDDPSTKPGSQATQLRLSLFLDHGFGYESGIPLEWINEWGDYNRKIWPQP